MVGLYPKPAIAKDKWLFLESPLPISCVLRACPSHSYLSALMPILDIFSNRSEPPEPGDTVGHFDLHELLGEGSFGRVYRATDNTLGRDVALKFLILNALQDDQDELKQRFVREARLMARILHPHLATIFEAELANDFPYIAMEFIPGKPLDFRVDNGPPFSIFEVCTIGQQVTQALAYALTHKVIHRDLKPDNIMFVDDSNVKVVDMGIAKPLDDSATFATMTAMTIGTLNYMAPEQHRGDDLDHRADIYALGIVLVEMATGELPFPGQSAPCIYEGKEEGLPWSLKSKVPDMPDSLVSLLEGMLAFEPEDREDSYAHILSELRKAAMPVAAATPAPSHSSTARKKRPKGVKPASPVRSTAAAPSPVPEKKKSLPKPSRPKQRAATAKVPRIRKSGKAADDATREPIPVASAKSVLEVGRYRLRDRIGDGTVGVVYKAENQDTGEIVALKRFRTSDAEDVEELSWRFQTTGGLITTFDHPNICPIYEFGTDGTTAFAVSQLLLVPENRPFSLNDYRESFGEDGVLASNHVRHLGYLLLDGLNHAHKMGVAHGDVTPDNLLFEYMGEEEGSWRLHLKITDFSKGALVNGSAALAKRHEKLRPQAYLSPEQRKGATASPECDIYAVAAILFECLTGQTSFKERLTSLRPELDEDWEPVLGKALRKDPARRFHDATEFASYLELLE
jgi:serine/threonine protein kinase